MSYKLEGLYLSAGLGTPRDSPGRAGGSGWGEGCLGDDLLKDYLETAASVGTEKSESSRGHN